MSETILRKAILRTLRLLTSLNGRLIPFLGIDSNGVVQYRGKMLNALSIRENKSNVQHHEKSYLLDINYICAAKINCKNKEITYDSWNQNQNRSISMCHSTSSAKDISSYEEQLNKWRKDGMLGTIIMSDFVLFEVFKMF